MSPLTADENAYYKETLEEAVKIVESLSDAKVSNVQSLVAAVYASIVKHVHFLRQEPPKSNVTIHVPEPDPYPPKKLSRIPLEGTPWRDSTSPWGTPQQGCSRDKLIDQSHKDLLNDIVDSKRGQPEAKVEIEWQGHVYSANQAKNGVWYLNRRLQK